ncbi:MAG: Rrf2 family transcriptional regulator [Candidatus Kryptonium sp.]|nr:Rrf2 family transcriptional regulator [Candidatus Kryptonium sp.]MCX7762597.1 Rrf2 family transcriptional regulator [Candidatus Kryptonium sp.]MDW8109626.1 Rrf2 family transcriptional regulator [Candidatus Kryptonium sp.]
MSGLLSKTAEYGMRAVLYIALNQSDNKKDKKRISTKDIAKDLKVPYHFLAKVIQKLVKAGIIHSKRGKNGGFFLKKSPEKVKLIDVGLLLKGKNFLQIVFSGFQVVQIKILVLFMTTGRSSEKR